MGDDRNWTFQYVSDLHLEYNMTGGLVPRFWDPPSARFLILAGDIDMLQKRERVYRTFLMTMAERYEHVIWVLGNHEFFGTSVLLGRELASQIAASIPRVTLLDASGRLDLHPRLRVVGATLWTDIPVESSEACVTRVTDFRNISDMTLAHRQVLYVSQRLYLIQEIDEARRGGQSLVVVTHHPPAPAGTSPPLRAGSSTSAAFVGDLRSLLTPPVVAWVAGHTHHSYAYRAPAKEGPLLLSNQLGYVAYGEQTCFSSSAFFSVSMNSPVPKAILNHESLNESPLPEVDEIPRSSGHSDSTSAS